MNNGMGFDCIMLAAGISSRMGKWKMTLPLHGSTIIENSVENAKESCDRIFLITGYRSDELKDLFKNDGTVTCIFNEEYETDMFSSVRKGCEYIESDYFYVALGDMPFIKPWVYKELAPFAGDKAVYPEFENRLGHPVLLPNTIIPLVQQSTEIHHMRELLKDYPSRSVPVDCEGVIQDIDTREDYFR
jgi:molybdenum cofactor cytidylyltransferase